MAVRTATAEWKGNLREGNGTLATETGAVDGSYSFRSRFGDGSGGTNPEELIGAAHAGCFSMAFANVLAEHGHEPESVRTTARVKLGENGEGITGIELECRARVPGIERDEFERHAEEAKKGCPVSQALGAVDIRLDARLEE